MGLGKVTYGFKQAPADDDDDHYALDELNQTSAPVHQPEDLADFFNDVDDIRRCLMQYDDNIERIEALHKRSLAETNLESEEFIQRQLDCLLDDTRSLSHMLRDRIKRLESVSQHDMTKKTQAENLKRQFMTNIQKFQSTEAAFRQRYREVAERQLRIVDPEATDAEIQQAIADTSGQQIFSQALLQSNRRGEARAALTEVQLRQREIQKIEETLIELAELFQDMERLVAEQEEQVTYIDETVGKAQADIEHGIGSQRQAITYLRKFRRKKWWCIGIMIFIVVVLAVVLGAYFGTR